MSGKATRSARHVKTAATLLQKEARKILRRHAPRIAAEPADEMRACIAAIDTYRAAGEIDPLEREAERLDELLHQHATFARKSAFRETAENIAVAVLIALGLRACFYEPFKIPSGSMMPTLRNGDHIFVNKFIYGVQIPFTSTVIGQAWGTIEHADVVVFRYPLNDAEDYIKRVIGLPGDEVKVQGRIVSVKEAGAPDFEVLPHQLLDEPCRDEDGIQEVPDCQLYHETFGERTYVVRYMSSIDEHASLSVPARIYKVPDDRILVMGDNRNQSHDSLLWMQRVEAVAADSILRDKDLRDLTEGRVFTLSRPDDVGGQGDGDPGHDHIVYRSTHRDPAFDVSLALWRNPTLSADAVFSALEARMPAARTVAVAELLAGEPDSPATDRAREIGAAIDRLALGETSSARLATAYLAPSRTVLELTCGKAICRSPAELARRMTTLIGDYERDHEQEARSLVPRDAEAHYGTHWTGRSNVREHIYETAFRKPGSHGPRDAVRLRVLRKPKENLDVLLDAALREAGRTRADADRFAGLTELAFTVEGDDVTHFIAADIEKGILLALECGRTHCSDARAVQTLARRIWPRVPEAALDHRRLRDLLRREDVPGTEESPVPTLTRAPYDRAELEATVEGTAHSIELEVWRQPAEGLAARVAAVRQDFGMQPDDRVATGGASLEDDASFHFVVPVESSETVLRVRCNKGLCPTKEVALHVARRAHAQATDVTAFVDPEAERPRPYVPRGNVKGRAERIWLPMKRFWLPIR